MIYKLKSKLFLPKEVRLRIWIEVGAAVCMRPPSIKGGPARYTGRQTHDAPRRPIIPIKGTASDVVGIFSATRLRNTVNERRMVTPEIKVYKFDCVLDRRG